MQPLITLSFIASAVLVLSGCTAKLTEPEITFTPPKYVEEMPSREEENSFAARGSLFGQGDSPLFSDHKAMHVNDIVTVVISEQASSSNKADKALSEEDDSKLKAGVFTAGPNANSALSNVISKLNGGVDIGFEGSSSSSYTGSGSATKNATFTTTVSSRIVKVMSNGNYFIVGRREIMIDDQKQIMQLSGVIRPYDIDQNNQINSAKISDAKIMYANEGDVDRSINRGWGSKLVEAVWPF